MTKQEIFEKVKTILTDHLGLKEKEVTLNSKLGDDLGAGSLDILELVMNFEDEFEMKVSDENAEKMLTVGDIVSYIEEYSPLYKSPPATGTSNTSDAPKESNPSNYDW